MAEAETDLEVDGAIQRFEFTYELYWKLLKDYLEKEGILCQSPRGCFKEAFRLRLFDDESTALRMIEDRNETVHLYDEEKSREVYGRIRTVYIELYDFTLRRVTGGRS